MDVTTERIGFYLIEDFSMMSLMAAVEPLRSANRQLNRQAYAWSYVGLDPGKVCASSGIDVTTCASIRDVPPVDTLFICAGINTDPANRSAINAALRRMKRADIKLGAISTGTFILARAGLIGQARCTVHWEYLPSFQQEFPDIAAEDALYVHDRDIYTSSGGLACADMMLHRIGERHGGELARIVCNQFQIDRIRKSSETQRYGTLDRLVTLPSSIREAIALMVSHIEEPLTIAAITRRIGTPPRQLERLFQAQLRCTPMHFYRARRLEKAHDLMMHTNLPLIEIAQMTGYKGHAQFTAAYRSHFGQAPNTRRREAVLG